MRFDKKIERTSVIAKDHLEKDADNCLSHFCIMRIMRTRIYYILFLREPFNFYYVFK